jgi:hypothetical protein
MSMCDFLFKRLIYGMPNLNEISIKEIILPLVHNIILGMFVVKTIGSNLSFFA